MGAALSASLAALVFALPAAATELPGGTASYTGPIDRQAFSHPSSNLSLERKLDFQIGNGLFKRLWVTAPASTQAADGLGPLYNARACQRCHVRDGRGHPPEDPADNAVSLVLRLSIPAQNAEQQRQLDEGRLKTIPEPTYGHQLQDFAIAGHSAEGRLGVSYTEHTVTLADGTEVSLRQPDYRVLAPAYGPLHQQAMLSPRIAPAMIGLGLLEAVAERDILALADPNDSDGDGISGKPNRVWSQSVNRPMLGRFGWKAGSPSIDDQSQEAFATDIGISVPLHPDGAGDCTPAQIACRQAPNGNSPQYDNLEASRQVTELVAHYARHLAVPARRDADHPDVQAGERLFHQAGCSACHQPGFITDPDATDKALASQSIRPYTDLLLHDMGEGLADNRPEGQANGREWRTAPLWGIGLTPTVSGHSYYLHDGRARNLLEAILWHGGEAQAARDNVRSFSAKQRHQLIRFVESL